MKPEQIDKLINGIVQLGMWAISALSLLGGWQLFIKERSVGKTALNKLKEEHASIKKEFEDMKRDHAELSEGISSIESKYERLFERIINNFPFKN